MMIADIQLLQLVQRMMRQVTRKTGPFHSQSIRDDNLIARCYTGIQEDIAVTTCEALRNKEGCY